MRHGTAGQESATNSGKAGSVKAKTTALALVSLPAGAVPVAAPCAISGCQYGNAVPSAEARRIDYGSMWGFMRSVLTQGAAIYQDFAAGNLKDYEEYSARVDAAARERDDELKSLPSATAATWKPIATAPTDGTEILLTQWSEQDGYGETDFGSWGFIENSDADQQAIYGWLSNYGRVDEPTHWMEVATPDSGKADK